MSGKKAWLWLLALAVALAPLVALADDAGALSEGELNVWLTQALSDTRRETPMNAPVGEESLTEDGYAFLYSFATFYYDKPRLDEHSVLKAITLTAEAYPTLRGIKLGDDQSALIESFGWQNPMLLGNGSFAAFYVSDQLPQAAYWSWARHEGERLLNVQCSLHVRTADNLYTDAGVRYTVENGKISGFQVFGLDQKITAREVRSNVSAVHSVQAAISGDEHLLQEDVEGYYEANDAAAFRAEDLLFGGVNFCSFTQADAARLFGQAQSQEQAKDDTGALLTTAHREGLTLSYTLSPEGRETLDTMSVQGNLVGPRGVAVGMASADALRLFQSDGKGAVKDEAAILYGDGETAPTGLLQLDEGGNGSARYLTDAPSVDGQRTVTLLITFHNDRVSEWMVYSW